MIDLNEILAAHIQKVELANSDYFEDMVTPDGAKKAMLQACQECLRGLDAELFELFCNSKTARFSRNRMLTEYERTDAAQAIQRNILNVEKQIKL